MTNAVASSIWNADGSPSVQSWATWQSGTSQQPHLANPPIELRQQAAPAFNVNLAPAPIADKWPTVVGSSLSLAYLSATYRLALSGYRRQYVDALGELIERDPHLYAVLMQRVMTACGARIILAPRDAKSKRARRLTKDVQSIVDSITGLRQSMVSLAFSGFYYGMGAAETIWEPQPRYAKRGPAIGYVPTRLNFVHSRRLNLPNPSSWDVSIWDQGPVNGMDSRLAEPTRANYGLRIDDYPGKFVLFSPQLHADYPTREGVGRVVAFWSALKTMGARGAAQYVERYAKPWAVATYATTSNGVPRAAEASAVNNDVGAADQALRALGAGSLAGVVIPDSVKITLQQIVGSRSAIGHKDWIDICNREMSKGVLGQTDTTDGGGSGSRARASVQKTGSDQIARLDVMLLADCLQTMLVDWIVRLNWPADYDLRPFITLAVDPEPDPYGTMKLASMAAASGMPVDADKLSHIIGIALVDRGDLNARVLAPVKPMITQDLHPDLFPSPAPSMQAQADITADVAKTEHDHQDEMQKNSPAAADPKKPASEDDGDEEPADDEDE